MNFQITKDFPGGNIHVLSIAGNEIHMEQELRDSLDLWFYWRFDVTDMDACEELQFYFENGDVIGPWGPAVSYDGIHWDWLGEDSVITRAAFRYTPPEGVSKVSFSFSLPYYSQDFDRFIAPYLGHPWVERKVLCLSEGGREVPVYVIGDPQAQHDVIFTARHHACESIGSYVLQGALSAILPIDSWKYKSPLLRNYKIHVIPFIDLDGVENGDQGKERAPHDHNRDYGTECRYNSVRALREYAAKLDVRISTDFHSLYKWDCLHDHPLFVHQAGIKYTGALGRELRLLCREQPTTEVLRYEQIYDKTPYIRWDAGPEAPATIENSFTLSLDKKLLASSSWFTLRGTPLSITFETPYFGVVGNVVTQKNALGLGICYAHALEVLMAGESEVFYG